MALGGGWPAACATPVWRDCAMGETPVGQLALQARDPK
jgi:hypothetical protein